MSFLTKKVTAHVKMENITTTISNLTQIPLFKVIYLLKESLVGLERLVNKFGFFKVTSDMIVINKDFKCNVWIN